MTPSLNAVATDLNSVACIMCAWSTTELRVYRMPVTISTKQRLLVERKKLDHSIVVAVISQWRRHHSACIYHGSRWTF